MAGGMNLATKYAKEIDERWETESLMPLISSNNYNFKAKSSFQFLFSQLYG